MDMFEKATRKKLRFNIGRGEISVEGLWDLPLQNMRDEPASLDGVAKALHRGLKAASEESFVTPVASVRKGVVDDELKLEIVKHIITVKVAERDRAAAAEARRKQRAAVAELIAKKEGEKLEGMELDQLRNLYAALNETDGMDSAAEV